MARYFYPHTSKITVQEALSLTTKFLNSKGYFEEGHKCGSVQWKRDEEVTGSIWVACEIHGDNSYVQLQYTNTDFWTEEKTQNDYRVNLICTYPHFGGKRWWFECLHCNKHVGAIHLVNGSKKFYCRHCLDLSYASRNENRKGTFGVFGKIFDYEEKIEKLWNNGKYLYYTGKPTKRYLRYLSISLPC